MAEIHTAVERGKTARVKEILAADSAAMHLRDDLGDQPLHLASRNGRTSIAELLLDAGADINAEGDRGQTPLHFATWDKRMKLLKLLISRGADPAIEDNNGATPLYLAASTHDEPICEFLRGNGVPVDPRSAIYLESPAAAMAKFTSGPSSLVPERAQQMLGDAIRVGSVEFLVFLLDRGADANQKSLGSLPLLQAASEQQRDIVRVLLERGADVKARDHVGRPLLKFCDVYGVGEDIIALLKHHGATE